MKTSPIKPFALLLCALLLASCKQKLRPLNIIGTWQQTSIANQWSDCEPIIYDCPNLWTFNPDSTVTIYGEEENDSGTWNLTPDSTLTLKLTHGDEANKTYKVMMCTSTQLACQRVIEDEFGDIIETFNLTKQE